MNKKLLLLTVALLSLSSIMAKKDSNVDNQTMNKPSRSCTTNKHHHRKNQKQCRHHDHHRNPIFEAPVDAVEGAGTVAKDVLEIPGAIFGGRCHNCDQE